MSVEVCGFNSDNSAYLNSFSRGLRWAVACQEYLCLNTRKIHPILLEEGKKVTLALNQKEKHFSLWVTAFKIATYITVILPLIALFFIYFAKRKYVFCYEEKANKVISREAIQKMIKGAKSAAKKQTQKFDCVLNDLYLGNRYGLFSTLDVQLTNKTEKSEHFHYVITMNPLSHIRLADGKGASLELSEAGVRKRFQEKNINWIYAGQGLSDAKSDEPEASRKMKWAALVHDTTFFNSKLGSYVISHDCSKEEYTENIRNKQTIILAHKVENWFKSAFEILDKGVFDGKRVLVHCVEGKSRSVSLVAAYLINRFNVTFEEAISFIKSKRACVNPQFAKELKEYEEALRLSRVAEAVN